MVDVMEFGNNDKTTDSTTLTHANVRGIKMTTDQG